MEWYKYFLHKYFVGLEQGFCKDFAECIMRDGKPKLASKYSYFYLQKNDKWGKRNSQVLMKN
jgi:hypothetical protein